MRIDGALRAPRAQASSPPPRVVVRDPLGPRVERVVDAPARTREVLVLPRVEPRARAGRRRATGPARARRRGRPALAAEVDLDGLRPHREGAPASRIFWPALARGGRADRAPPARRRRHAPARRARPARAARARSLDAAVRAAASLPSHLAARRRLRAAAARRPAPERPRARRWPAGRTCTRAWRSSRPARGRPRWPAWPRGAGRSSTSPRGVLAPRAARARARARRRPRARRARRRCPAAAPSFDRRRLPRLRRAPSGARRAGAWPPRPERRRGEPGRDALAARRARRRPRAAGASAAEPLARRCARARPSPSRPAAGPRSAGACALAAFVALARSGRCMGGARAPRPLGALVAVAAARRRRRPERGRRRRVGAPARARRWRSRSWRSCLLAAGVPLRLLVPDAWDDLAAGLGQASAALPGVARALPRRRRVGAHRDPARRRRCSCWPRWPPSGPPRARRRARRARRSRRRRARRRSTRSRSSSTARAAVPRRRCLRAAARRVPVGRAPARRPGRRRGRVARRRGARRPGPRAAARRRPAVARLREHRRAARSPGRRRASTGTTATAPLDWPRDGPRGAARRGADERPTGRPPRSTTSTACAGSTRTRVARGPAGDARSPAGAGWTAGHARRRSAACAQPRVHRRRDDPRHPAAAAAPALVETARAPSITGPGRCGAATTYRARVYTPRPSTTELRSGGHGLPGLHVRRYLTMDAARPPAVASPWTCSRTVASSALPLRAQFSPYQADEPSARRSSSFPSGYRDSFGAALMERSRYRRTCAPGAAAARGVRDALRLRARASSDRVRAGLRYTESPAPSSGARSTPSSSTTAPATASTSPARWRCCCAWAASPRASPRASRPGTLDRARERVRRARPRRALLGRGVLPELRLGHRSTRRRRSRRRARRSPSPRAATLSGDAGGGRGRRRRPAGRRDRRRGGAHGAGRRPGPGDRRRARRRGGAPGRRGRRCSCAAGAAPGGALGPELAELAARPAPHAAARRRRD